MSPLLSIVVPSKNRHYYLKFLVEYFHSIKSDKIELIIQDNSSEELVEEFQSFINSIDDSRIKYFYSNKEMCINENCDLAIAKTSGEYITMIGDDDIFSKHIIEFTEQFKKEGLEAILPIKSSYTWPDVNPRFYGKSLSGSYLVNTFDSKRKKINAKKELDKVLKLGGSDILNLPRVYHGIIRRDILEKVFEQSNSYFPAPSPDMANATALCKYIENFEIINIPLIISGHSVSSGGGQGAQGQHYGEIAKLKHLPKDTAANWTSKVPFYWSGYTIYAESMIQCIKRMDMKGYLEKFNFEYMMASCFVFDTNYKDRIELVYNTLSSSSKLKIKYYIMIVWLKRLFFHFKKNIKSVWKNMFNKDLVYKKTNILEVAILTDELIEAVTNKRLM